jgi:hypothetical protein
MRIKLCEKYKQEREELLHKIMQILNCEENKSFTLYELDENKEKQEAIINLKDELKKYFAVSSIAPFKPNIISTKRDYLNIVRGIFRQEGYKLLGKDKNIIDKDGNTKRTIKYYLIKE